MKKIINNSAASAKTDIFNMGYMNMLPPSIVPIMHPDGTITNVSVGVFVNSDIEFYDYIKKHTILLYIGEIVVIERPVSKYGHPDAYIIQHLNLDNDSNEPILKHIGEVMLSDGKIIKNKEILQGAIYTYNSKDYVYFNDEWKPLYGPDCYINNEKINTPSDIIAAFDDLQKRATEIGYPIKLFAKERPIHPIHNACDTTLLLTYDESCPNAILAAIRITQTLEKLMGGLINANA